MNWQSNAGWFITKHAKSKVNNCWLLCPLCILVLCLPMIDRNSHQQSGVWYWPGHSLSFYTPVSTCIYTLSPLYTLAFHFAVCGLLFYTLWLFFVCTTQSKNRGLFESHWGENIFFHFGHILLYIVWYMSRFEWYVGFYAKLCLIHEKNENFK